MSWVVFSDFPLDADLSILHRRLDEHRIPHRFTEEQGMQRLWLADASFAPLVERVLSNLDHAEGSPPEPWLSESGTPDVNVRSPDPSRHASRGQSATLAQFSLVPLTSIVIVLGLLGFATRYFGLETPYFLLVFGSFDYIAQSGEYWRILTPAFLHFGVMHIVFNALWIWEVGKRLEPFMGKLHYLGLFVFSAILANLAQASSGQGFDFGGLSGVVYGYFGCVFILSRKWPRPELVMPQGIFIFMLVWLGAGFFGLIDFFIPGSVANWAHLGGLIAGLVYGLMFAVIRK